MTVLALLDVVVIDILAFLALPLLFVLPCVIWFKFHCCFIISPDVQWGVVLFCGLYWLIALCAMIFVGVVCSLAFCADPLSWTVGW